jgi:stress response protein SCP2
MMNELGEISDAVFYNKLVSDCGCIKLLGGDSKDGSNQGYDEEIHIDFMNF